MHIISTWQDKKICKISFLLKLQFHKIQNAFGPFSIEANSNLFSNSMTSLASVIQFLIYCKRSSSRPLQLHFTTSFNILCMLFIKLSAITAQAIPTCVAILSICEFGTPLNKPSSHTLHSKAKKLAPKPAA